MWRACGFRDRLNSFSDRDVVVLGVSPDSVESHARFADKYGLPFPLLADEGHALAEQYGVWVEKKLYGNASMGIARTTFVIDPEGRIAHVFRNVRAEGHEQQVLDRLQIAWRPVENARQLRVQSPDLLQEIPHVHQSQVNLQERS